MFEFSANCADGAEETFARWVDALGLALESADYAAAATMLLPTAHLKSSLALSWKMEAFTGPEEVTAGLAARAPIVQPKNIRVSETRSRARWTEGIGIEGFIDLETSVGPVAGYARLHATEDGTARASMLHLALQGLHGFEESIGERRPDGTEFAYSFAGDNWSDSRAKTRSFEDRGPQVVIVGAGHGGLSTAARLGQLGVDVLVIERHPRVGDNWRTRYRSLTLHNEVTANHLPYLPYPATWPRFIPKDKLANWIEGYAEAMELNVWTDSELTHADYNNGTWTVTVRHGGEERTIRTPHIILATGAGSGTPHVPSIPGLQDFKGDVIHSNEFVDGSAYAGKRALVIGTGNSGHDCAQDLYSNGAADVAIMQRNGTGVVSMIPSAVSLSRFNEGFATEDVDLAITSETYDSLVTALQSFTRMTCELDRELLDRLEKAGFELSFEEDETGFFMQYLRRGGGYYINVGCSDLIADGKIRLVKARDAERITETGLRLKDGAESPLDVIVLATGYQNQQEMVRKIFGNDIADRIGTIWGFDESGNGEMRNMWVKTVQPGLWFGGGNMVENRPRSRQLALQVKATLEGIMPASI